MAIWTSKFGTKIDLSGLDAKTIAEVKRLADSKYGTKAAALADSTRKKTGGKTTPTTKPTPAQGLSDIAANTNFKDPNSVAAGQTEMNTGVATFNTRTANPNEVGPYGSKNITYDAEGRPTVTTELSGPNKALFEGQSQAGTLGSQVASGLLGNFNYDPSSVDAKYGIPEVNQDYINRYQDAAYNALTRRLEQSYGKDKEAKAQELVNRGIPQGSQQFQDEMNRDIENRYADARESAANQAYSSGLGAAQTYSTMGLQANQQAMNNYNTMFGNRAGWANQLNNMAQVQNPNFQPFQGSQAQAANLEGIYGTESARRIQEEQNRIARSRAAGGGGGGGGGGQPASGQPTIDL